MCEVLSLWSLNVSKLQTHPRVSHLLVMLVFEPILRSQISSQMCFRGQISPLSYKQKRR